MISSEVATRVAAVVQDLFIVGDIPAEAASTVDSMQCWAIYRLAKEFPDHDWPNLLAIQCGHEITEEPGFVAEVENNWRIQLVRARAEIGDQ